MPAIPDLRDAVVVVTGAASGIGFALADAFLGVGARVVLADIEAPALALAEQRLGTPRRGSCARGGHRRRRPRCRRAPRGGGARALRSGRRGVQQRRDLDVHHHRPPHDQRLGVGTRCRFVGRDPRSARVPPDHAGTRNAVAHRQHRVGRGAHERHRLPRAVRGGEGRRGVVVGDPPRGDGGGRRTGRRQRPVPRLHRHERARLRPEPARAVRRRDADRRRRSLADHGAPAWTAPQGSIRPSSRPWSSTRSAPTVSGC